MWREGWDEGSVAVCVCWGGGGRYSCCATVGSARPHRSQIKDDRGLERPLGTGTAGGVHRHATGARWVQLFDRRVEVNWSPVLSSASGLAGGVERGSGRTERGEGRRERGPDGRGEGSGSERERMAGARGGAVIGGGRTGRGEGERAHSTLTVDGVVVIDGAVQRQERCRKPDGRSRCPQVAVGWQHQRCETRGGVDLCGGRQCGLTVWQCGLTRTCRTLLSVWQCGLTRTCRTLLTWRVKAAVSSRILPAGPASAPLPARSDVIVMVTSISISCYDNKKGKRRVDVTSAGSGWQRSAVKNSAIAKLLT